MPDAPLTTETLRRFIGRALAVWLVLMTVESAHGVLRALFLAPRVGDFRSRQIGVVTGSALILVVVRLFIRWIRAPGAKSPILAGALWVALTVAFELSLGRLAGRSWAGLLSDYDIPNGGLLPFGLAVLALSPWIVARRPRR